VFLFLIGSLNLVILHGIGMVFRAMRRGEYDEAELERQLDNRGDRLRDRGPVPGEVARSNADLALRPHRGEIASARVRYGLPA
jgi:nickel/cobalt transporter (NiCoT) family protein